jgi:hypothetical protein
MNKVEMGGTGRVEGGNRRMDQRDREEVWEVEGSIKTQVWTGGNRAEEDSERIRRLREH